MAMRWTHDAIESNQMGGGHIKAKPPFNFTSLEQLPRAVEWHVIRWQGKRG